MIEIILPPEQGFASFDEKAGVVCPHVVLVVDPDTGAPVAKQMEGEVDTVADWERRCKLGERNNIFLPIYDGSTAHMHLGEQTKAITATIKERELLIPGFSKSSAVGKKSKNESYTLVLRTVRENGADVTYALFTYAYTGPRGQVEGGLMLPGGRGEINEAANLLARRQLQELTGLDFPTLTAATEDARITIDGLKKTFFCVVEDLRDADPESISWVGSNVHLGRTAGVCWVRVTPGFAANISKVFHLDCFNDTADGPGAASFWNAHVSSAATLFLMSKHVFASEIADAVTNASIYLQRAYDELDKKEKVPKKVCEDEAPVLNEDLRNFVVATGFPVTAQDKLSKLKKYVKTKILDEIPFKDIIWSTDGEGGCDGTGFIEFESAAVAKQAAKVVHNAKIGKKNILKASLLSEFDAVLDTPADFAEPTLTIDEDEEDVHSYLLQPAAFDQFVTMSEGTVSVFECGYASNNELRELKKFSEKNVAFSPLGSYMVSFLKQGIVLYGKTNPDGTPYRSIQKFQHSRVSMVDFSPDEKYLVTFSDASKKTVRIFDIASGNEVRGFSVPVTSWPLFKWCHDSKYCARQVDNGIFLYDVENGFKKSNIVIPRVTEFSWSPKQSMICYSTPEFNEKPFRLALMDIPSKDDIVTRNMIDAKECRTYWQKDGQFMCAQVQRLGQAKKIVTYLELFHVSDKSLPYDHLEVPFAVLRFHWEPIGDKFAVLTFDEETGKYDTKIYQISDKKVLLLWSNPATMNTIVAWAPCGRYAVVTNISEDDAQLLFLSIAPEKKRSKLLVNEPQRTNEKCVVEVLETQIHDKVTNIAWDPTGRYVATSVRFPRAANDNGYKLWTFTGQFMREVETPRLDFFKWRPRPEGILSAQDLAQIEGNFAMHAQVGEAARNFESAKKDDDWVLKMERLQGQWGSLIQSKASRALEFEEFFRGIYADEELVEVVEEELELLSREEKTIPTKTSSED